MYCFIPACLVVDVPATHEIVWQNDIIKIACIYWGL